MRKLDKKIIKIIKDMPIIYDIEQDHLYIQGMKKGMEKGMEKRITGLYDLEVSINKIAKAFEITTEKVKEVLRKHNKLK